MSASASAREVSWRRQLLNAYKDKQRQEREDVKLFIELCLQVVDPGSMPDNGVGRDNKAMIIAICADMGVLVTKGLLTEGSKTAEIKEALKAKNQSVRNKIARKIFKKFVDKKEFLISKEQLEQIFEAAFDSKQSKQKVDRYQGKSDSEFAVVDKDIAAAVESSAQNASHLIGALADKKAARKTQLQQFFSKGPEAFKQNPGGAFALSLFISIITGGFAALVGLAQASITKQSGHDIRTGHFLFCCGQKSSTENMLAQPRGG